MRRQARAIIDYRENVEGKVVLWTWHRAFCQELAAEMHGQPGSGDVRWVTGDMHPETRAEQVRRFQNHDGRATLVATIASLSEGIALDTASACLFAERSWLPSQNVQAAARILGPRQQGSPLVVTFIVEDSIEERLDRVLRRKSDACDRFTTLRAVVEEARG